MLIARNSAQYITENVPAEWTRPAYICILYVKTTDLVSIATCGSLHYLRILAYLEKTAFSPQRGSHEKLGN